MKKIIIIDSNWLINKTYHVSKYNNKDFDLSKNETYVPLMRKLFTDISSLLRSLKLESYDEVYFSFDRGKSRFRTEILPSYKGTRDEKDLYFIHFIEDVSYILSNYYNTIIVPGVESDDIISVLSSWYKKSKTLLVYIISGDEDLQQLIDENIVVLTPLKGENRYSIVNGFKIQQLVELNNTSYQVVDKKLLLLNKILLGCDSDNVPRLLKKGIGPKTIERFYNDNGFYQNLEDKDIYTFIEQFCKERRYVIDMSVLESQISLVDLSLSEKCFTQLNCDEFEECLSKTRTVGDLVLPTSDLLLKNTKFVSNHV